METHDRLFASCDSKYFMEHAPAYVHSCFINGYDSCVNVVNPTKEVADLAVDMEDVYENTFKYFPETIHNFDEKDAEYKRVYYSCNRFYAARTILRHHDDAKLVITDIDCFVNKPFPIFDVEQPIGLYTRAPLEGCVGWEEHGTHIAAGMVLINDPVIGKDFLERVCDKIEMYTMRWFVDQVALWETYNDMELDTNNKQNCFQLTSEHMDWEFTPNSFMWTGKGDRKYTNDKYVKRKAQLTDDSRALFHNGYK